MLILKSLTLSERQFPYSKVKTGAITLRKGVGFSIKLIYRNLKKI